MFLKMQAKKLVWLKFQTRRLQLKMLKAINVRLFLESGGYYKQLLVKTHFVTSRWTTQCTSLLMTATTTRTYLKATILLPEGF